MKAFLRRLTAALCVVALCLTSALALEPDEALRLLEENYIDELPPAAYEAATLDELFAALEDPYTYYMTAEEYEGFTSGVESEGNVTGLGAMIEYTAGGIVLQGILEGSGAQDAGLEAGDLIIAVDGVSCVPAGETHRAMILGEEGTTVTLTVQHRDGTVQDHIITRKTVSIHNTTVSVRGSAGWIDCNSFGSQTGRYFREGVEKYNDQVSLWVVDLRGNGGGLASAAVDALSAFVGAGPHLHFRNRAGGYSYQFAHDDALTNKPLIVLIDENTASASEVFAGCIRAYDAGIILGPRSYGKGVAQIVLDKESNPELFDGDSLKITAYRFFSPDSNTPDRIGVIPTLYLPDAYVNDAVSLLRTDAPDGDHIQLALREHRFFISLEEALAPAKKEAFLELLSALPPDAVVTCTDSSGELRLEPDLTAAYYQLPVPTRYFPDAASSPFRLKIDALGAYRILRGKGDGRFDPTATLTRAELCAMLAQALNVASETPAGFTDVIPGSWYAPGVDAMARLGLVQGTGDGRFLPDGTLTQEQFFTVMGRLAAFLNDDACDYSEYLSEEKLAADPSLAPYAVWSRNGVKVLNGLLLDMNDNPAPMLWAPLDTIDPHSAVTREQAAATLFNVLRMLGMLIY